MTATELTTSSPPAMAATGPATPAQASLYQQLRAHLATLTLHDAAEHLPAVLDQATAEGLSLTAALERLLAAEVTATQACRLAGRLRFACLPTPATLEDFDYDAAPGVDPKLINELATCRYLDTATNLLLIGPSWRLSPGSPAGVSAGIAGRAATLKGRTYWLGSPTSSRRDRIGVAAAVQWTEAAWPASAVVPFSL
jgi:hypothetical protein